MPIISKYFINFLPMVIMVIIAIILSVINNYQKQQLDNKLQTGVLVVLSNGYTGQIINIHQDILTIKSGEIVLQCLKSQVLHILDHNK